LPQVSGRLFRTFRTLNYIRNPLILIENIRVFLTLSGNYVLLTLSSALNGADINGLTVWWANRRIASIGGYGHDAISSQVRRVFVRPVIFPIF